MNSASSTNETFRILKQALQKFQAKRIRATYDDIIKMPQYTKLGHFFFEQIYGPRDFGFRNRSIKSLHRKLSGFLRGEIIAAVGKVIELNDLSDELDNRMVEKMIERHTGPQLNMELYGEIYRDCDNYDRRVHQINLMVEAVQGIHHVSQIRFIGWSLKAVSKAAHLAGMGKIMDFLTQGYDAFRSTKDIDFFTKTIAERELALNDRLFGKKQG